MPDPRRLSFGLAVAALLVGGCGTDGGGQGEADAPTGTNASARVTTCDYAGNPEPKPHPENRVRVSGGATCEEASDLFYHPAPDSEGEGGAIRPKPLEGWTCETDSKRRYGPIAFDCSKGPKRVRYLFH